jgi:hypothetical protein
MTKRHFEMLAATLRDCKPPWPTDSPVTHMAMTQWEFVCRRFARMCATHNPRFDRARFIQACGVDTPEGS